MNRILFLNEKITFQIVLSVFNHLLMQWREKSHGAC